jgi:hypothetical protein
VISHKRYNSGGWKNDREQEKTRERRCLMSEIARSDNDYTEVVVSVEKRLFTRAWSAQR